MDESGSDQEDDEKRKDQLDKPDLEPPTKRQALDSNGAADGESIPKWSNPDPYSVLPPVDEVHRKRKDPVAFIRKAFKPAESKAIAQSQVAANDDFISFNDDVAESTRPSSRSHSESRSSPGCFVLDIGEQTHARYPANETDPSLGSRKRTYDDELKSTVKALSAHPNGSLLEPWLPRTVVEATPWVDRETSSVLSPAFKLHREICDFFEFVRPQQHEQVVRQALLSRLQELISRELPDCTYY